MLSEYSKYAKIAIKDTPINIKNAKISKKQKFTNFATFLRFILFTNELVTTFSLIASSTFSSIYICLHIFITCLRCIFEEPPTGCETCESHGIIGASAGMIGCIQALEAIKFITSRERLLTDKMFIFDMLTMKTRTAKFGGISSRCSICQNNQ